jgi:hypothetical protein
VVVFLVGVCGTGSASGDNWGLKLDVETYGLKDLDKFFDKKPNNEPKDLGKNKTLKKGKKKSKLK